MVMLLIKSYSVTEKAYFALTATNSNGRVNLIRVITNQIIRICVSLLHAKEVKSKKNSFLR